ncbi:MAG: tetratricopeptide repeat protein [Terriglobia bacterium]
MRDFNRVKRTHRDLPGSSSRALRGFTHSRSSPGFASINKENVANTIGTRDWRPGAIIWLLWSLGALGFFPGVSPAHEIPPRSSLQKTTSKPIGNPKELVQKATALLENDKIADALPLLQQAIAVDPSDGLAHYYLGYCFWKKGQAESATLEFKKVLAQDPGNSLAQYYLGRIAQSKNQWTQAARYFEAILAGGDSVYDTYAQLSQVYQHQGQNEKALALLLRAVQAAPLDGSLQYRLGQVYRQLGRMEEAHRSLETAARLKQADQKSIQKTLDLSVAIQNKDTHQVMQLRGELLAESARDPDILMQMGVLLGGGGYYEPSIEPLQRAAAILPSSFEAQFNWGLSLVQLRRNQEAEAPLKKAVAIRPDSFEANTTLAVLYVSRDQTEEAIRYLRAARATRPDNTKVAAMLGQQYLRGFYFSDAIETLSAAVRLKPDDPLLRSLLVSAYQSDKQFDQGLKIAQESIRLFPSSAQAHFEVGELLAGLGRYQDSKPYYEKAIQLDSSFVEAYCSLGDTLIRNGDYQAAFEEFLAARSLDEHNVRAARGVGQSLNRLQRHSEAVAELERTIRLLPPDAQIYFELSQAYTRLGNQAKAKEAVTMFEQLRAKETKMRDAEQSRRFVAESEKNGKR